MLKLVTRTSALALWQANFVRSQLKIHHPELEVEIVGVKTTGDKWQDVALYKIGGKSVFVKELEESLLAHEADFAVHSLKDVPVELPDGLVLTAVLAREEPFDTLVNPMGQLLDQLAPNSRVGTSSLRRMVQLKALRPDVEYVPVRGNVDSRVKKCEQGEFAAIVLAKAGLKRLNLAAKIAQTFTAQELLPAVGQGALAIECRSDDERTRSLLSVLEDPITRNCVIAERTMSAALGGNCQVPIAGFAEYIEGKYYLTGRVGHPDRAILLEAQRFGTNPEQLGQQIAIDLIEQGAEQIIKEIRQRS